MVESESLQLWQSGYAIHEDTRISVRLPENSYQRPRRDEIEGEMYYAASIPDADGSGTVPHACGRHRGHHAACRSVGYGAMV